LKVAPKAKDPELNQPNLALNEEMVGFIKDLASE
jgi:hypothetical protein